MSDDRRTTRTSVRRARIICVLCALFYGMAGLGNLVVVVGSSRDYEWMVAALLVASVGLLVAAFAVYGRGKRLAWSAGIGAWAVAIGADLFLPPGRGWGLLTITAGIGLISLASGPTRRWYLTSEAALAATRAAVRSEQLAARRAREEAPSLWDIDLRAGDDREPH